MNSVYIDLYFLVNVSMDYLCLMITAILLHRRANRWRLLVAAVIGGFYAAAALLLGWEGFWGIVLDAVAVMLMCAVAFGQKKEWGGVLRAAAVTWLVSMLMGGVMTALYAALNRLNLPFESLQGDSLSIWSFVLVSALAGVLTVKGGTWLGFSRRTKTAALTVKLFGKRVQLRAMVDTGNLLCDPVSGRSVIVAELSALESVLPPDVLAACQNGDFTACMRDHTRARQLRLIPTRTASGESILLAIVPEALTVTVGKEHFAADYLIAPRPLHLADFDAIIGS